VPPQVLEQLDLSDEQINKIAKIRDGAFTAAKTYFDQLKTTDGKLRELQQPEGFNENEARKTLTAKAQVMTELELIRMRADAEIYGVLSAEQIMQAELLKQKHPMGPPPPDGFGHADGFRHSDGFRHPDDFEPPPPPDGMRPPAPPQN
jgi:Spy/CpxP family protein refolding chaperone